MHFPTFASLVLIALLLSPGCQKESAQPNPSKVEAPAAASENIAAANEVGFAPRMKPEWLPAAGRHLVFGASVEADLRQLWPKLKRAADRSLGGEGSVQYNGRGGVFLSSGRDTAWLVPAKDGAGPTLAALSVEDSALCKQLGETLGALPEASQCAGTNRVFGGDGRGWEYCLGDAAGAHKVTVSCRSDRLEYALGLK